MVRLKRERGIRRHSSFFHSADGYSYHFNRIMSGGRVSLRCMYYENRQRKCLARASCAFDGTDFRTGTVHRHRCTPNHYLVHCRRFRRILLNESRNRENSSKSLKEIYHQVRRSNRLPRQAVVSLPYVKVRPAMQRARASTLPPIPHTLSQLAQILEQDRYKFLTRTLDGEDNIFLGKFGQTRNNTRVVIFASERMLHYMGGLQFLMSDATFSSVPANLECAQIWNIITLRKYHIVPLVRVLMQSKLQVCYEVALRAIRHVLPHLNSQRVMCDFEAAQANAWSSNSVFPNITVDGCLFHSSKAIAGQANELGLTPLIRDNEQADSLVRSLCGLALLPHPRLEEGLGSVAVMCGDAGLFDELEPLLKYVRDTWLSPSKKRMFSVYKRKIRTNNGCESGNAQMASVMRQAHPNMWSFMFGLQDLEDTAKFDHDVMNSGRQASVLRRASALANDEIIEGHTLDLDEGNIDVATFLRRVSRQMQNVYEAILRL